MTVLRRLFLVVVASLLIVVRAIRPSMRIDEISLALFLLIALVVMWPDMQRLFANLRRLKLGGVELELAERVEKLATQADRAEEAQAKKRPSKTKPKEIPRDVAARIAEAASDPRAALLILAIELERAIRALASKRGLLPAGSTTHLVSNLTARGALPDEFLPTFTEFWQVRNRVVHEAGLDVPPGQIYGLVDIGLKLLRIVTDATS